MDLNTEAYDAGEASLRLRVAADAADALRARGGRVILCGHVGSAPKAGEWPSVSRHLKWLRKRLGGIQVAETLETRGLDHQVQQMQPGDVLVTPNVRSHPGETAPDVAARRAFAEDLGGMVDLYVNEAFSASHRNHATIADLPGVTPSVPGVSFMREVHACRQLRRRMSSGNAVFIGGGAKVRGKLATLALLADRMSALLVGGMLANPFLAALGVGEWSSADDREIAREVLDSHEHKIVLPVDVRLRNGTVVPVARAQMNDIVDVGPRTVRHFIKTLSTADAVLWNGPLGRYEYKHGGAATHAVGQALSTRSRGWRVIGGGDTLAALGMVATSNPPADHLSTGGGALTRMIASGSLPGTRALELET